MGSKIAHCSRCGDPYPRSQLPMCRWIVDQHDGGAAVYQGELCWLCQGDLEHAGFVLRRQVKVRR